MDVQEYTDDTDDTEYMGDMDDKALQVLQVLLCQQSCLMDSKQTLFQLCLNIYNHLLDLTSFQNY